ncbi:hypothetical protein [Spartinivicinus ruber]|uniref:hypothetical protein n=1 Tax=Spartinivicinus ruber TaxID=2683272 RepID=UPI0013D0CBC1|nr:hypothetical protein [Spartinivicinus ruber]
MEIHEIIQKTHKAVQENNSRQLSELVTDFGLFLTMKDESKLNATEFNEICNLILNESFAKTKNSGAFVYETYLEFDKLSKDQAEVLFEKIESINYFNYGNDEYFTALSDLIARRYPANQTYCLFEKKYRECPHENWHFCFSGLYALSLEHQDNDNMVNKAVKLMKEINKS